MPTRARDGLSSVGATETHPDAANRTAIIKGRVQRRIRLLWRTRATGFPRHALRRAAAEIDRSTPARICRFACAGCCASPESAPCSTGSPHGGVPH